MSLRRGLWISQPAAILPIFGYFGVPMAFNGVFGRLVERDDGQMHYPHRNSKIKRARKQGFRARMRSHTGRRLINRKRRHGFRKISVC